MGKGLFITFEGVDGCGKSLMIKKLIPRLEKAGYSVLSTREPGGSRVGTAIRRILLDSPVGSIDQRTEALCFAADRAHHCASVILPALAQGKIVLCDRFMDSTIAYQGYGRGLDLSQLQAFNDFAVGEAVPDLTILLDMDPDQAAQRLSGRRDRMEQEQADFFRRVAQGYRAIAAGQPQRIRVVDASRSVEQVSAAVWQAVRPLLPEPGGDESHD